MATKEQLQTAWALATEYHQGQMYGSETPYIKHLMDVTEGVKRFCKFKEYDDETVYAYMIVAILHDILEDTECTAPDLRHAGIPEHCIDAVLLVSKNHNWDGLTNYYLRIWGNHLALIVKREDTFKNLTQSHNECSMGRIAKYSRQLVRLNSLKEAKGE